VVDSSAVLRTRLVSRLIEAGLEVIAEAATAADALEHARAVVPDAIVLDVSLAERTGLGLIAELKAILPAAILVVFTNAQPYRRWCLKHGADHFLDKSTDFDAVAPILLELGRTTA
jgi:DNA-binding NarL/FixJ family response regulator